MNEVDTDRGPRFQPIRLAMAMGPAVQVRPDMTLQEVARHMLERDVDSVVLVDADGAARGVITDHDLTSSQSNLRLAALKVPRVNGHWVTSCDAVDAACLAATIVTAGEIINRRLTTANVLESIGTVVERMVHREAEYALVLEAGDVVGLLGRRALLRLVAGQVESPSPRDSSTAHYPTAHLALHGGGLPLWGWLAQLLFGESRRSTRATPTVPLESCRRQAQISRPTNRC